MLALPGSLLWVFLLVYLASGQILDTSDADSLDSWSQGSGNRSRVQTNEEEKEKKTHLAAREDEEETTQQDTDRPSLPVNTTSLPSSDCPQESNRTTTAGRNARRRPINGTASSYNATELPKISQERRNSYLSIAERRRYYNRTRVQPKKQQQQLSDAELDHQEARLLSSTTEAFLANEIRVVKKPVVTDFGGNVVTEKNITNNQRVVVSARGNETHGKPQTRQSVIQSQYQFGQKLNFRKSASRAQDAQDERLRKKKDKIRVESVVENSTNKLTKNYPTQSTKLIKLDKSLWPTTATPHTDHENLVMLTYGNGSAPEKLIDFVTVNVSDKVLINATSDVAGAENKSRSEVPPPGLTFGPVALTNLNVTAKDAKEKPPGDADRQNSSTSTVATKSDSHFDRALNAENATIRPTADTIRTATLLKNILSGPERAHTTPPSERSGKFSSYGAAPPEPPLRISTTNMKPVSQTETKTKIPSPTKPSGEENVSKVDDYPLTIELNENNKRVLSEMFQTITTSEPKKITKGETTTSQPKLTGASTNGFPTTNATATVSTGAPSAAPSDPTTPLSAEDVTTDSPQVGPPEDYPEDHKAQGTRFSTKFYISPNKSQVIRVVEEEEDEDEEMDAKGRSASVAIYVLAAFGLVPLLLALVFGTKFVMQRNQREYECESDAKSDISANEAQIKEGKKKKGPTDLKKSPSNVTTITLVTATRLPRVQHWENSDKQGNRNWEFPRCKLKLKTILGQGNFGQVWKAEAEDMAGHEGVTRLVAVKTVKEGATEKEHAEFIKELEIMQQIGSHPNIVTLLGCCTDQEPYYLIMEYVKYGKLLTYLREHRINENYFNFSNNSDALTSRDLTVFAYCVARGMEYLASRGIIHRDLAARNVLVDHNKLCKIADFGMSRSVRDFENGQVYEERQQKGALPIRWMAPESLVYSVFTYKSDVWSFGIVMWEIVTLGSTPYPNMGAREVMKKVRDGYRLERPSHCKPEFYRLISHCWAHDPNKRPEFSELRQELSCLLDNPTKDGSYVDLDRFAIDNSFHVSSKANDFRMLERNDFKTLQKLGDWDNKDWPEDVKKMRMKRGRNNGKGTVMLTGQGSFTVNSRILEKEFKMN